MQQNEIILSQKWIDKEFSHNIYPKIKLKKDAETIRRTYGGLSFENIKALKKVVGKVRFGIRWQNWANTLQLGCTIIAVSRVDGTYFSFVGRLSWSQQTAWWPLQQINDFSAMFWKKHTVLLEWKIIFFGMLSNGALKCETKIESFIKP